MEIGTDPHFGRHDETYLALISGRRSLPAMHISNKRRGRPEASSHSVNLSETMVFDDVHDQAYQEVLRCRDFLPFLEERAIEMEGLIAQSRDLAEKFGTDKIFLEKSIKLLSISRDAIDRLDEEGCHRLMRSIKKVLPHLPSMIPPPRDEAQPWASRIDLQPKESGHSTNRKVLLNNWYDHLYIELKYMNYMYAKVLIVEHRRLEWLISEGQVPANKVGSLKFFLEKSLNLMLLTRADISCAHKKECCMLAKMTKLFVMCKLIKGYANKGGEYQWPLPNLYAISEVLQQMLMKSCSDHVGPTVGFEAASNSQCPRPDGCLSEGDWHDQAYKELLSMRKLYSSQLDDAYNNIYMDRLCEVLVMEGTMFLQKSLDFLGTSRAEMDSLSKEKCHDRMMLIKFFAVLTSDSVSENQNSFRPRPYASINSTCPILLDISRNWRNMVYEEVRALGKKFSSVLDEAYRAKLGLCTQNPELATDLKDSLNFLGYSRATFAVDSMENCFGMLAKVRDILNCPEDFVSAEATAEFGELSSETYQVQNWRDEAYLEITARAPKYNEVETACQKLFEMSYQIPRLASQWKEVSNSLGRVGDFFAMSRSDLALLSKEEYNTTVESVNRDVATVEEGLTSLHMSIGKRIAFPCDLRKIKLKQQLIDT